MLEIVTIASGRYSVCFCTWTFGVDFCIKDILLKSTRSPLYRPCSSSCDLKDCPFFCAVQKALEAGSH